MLRTREINRYSLSTFTYHPEGHYISSYIRTSGSSIKANSSRTRFSVPRPTSYSKLRKFLCLLNLKTTHLYIIIFRYMKSPSLDSDSRSYDQYISRPVRKHNLHPLCSGEPVSGTHHDLVQLSQHFHQTI
jgi:hypothetical protein